MAAQAVAQVQHGCDCAGQCEDEGGNIDHHGRLSDASEGTCLIYERGAGFPRLGGREAWGRLRPQLRGRGDGFSDLWPRG